MQFSYKMYTGRTGKSSQSKGWERIWDFLAQGMNKDYNRAIVETIAMGKDMFQRVAVCVE